MTPPLYPVGPTLLPPSIYTATPLTGGFVAAAYSLQLTAGGGRWPFTYAVTAGARRGPRRRPHHAQPWAGAAAGRAAAAGGVRAKNSHSTKAPEIHELSSPSRETTGATRPH